MDPAVSKRADLFLCQHFEQLELDVWVYLMECLQGERQDTVYCRAGEADSEPAASASSDLPSACRSLLVFGQEAACLDKEILPGCCQPHRAAAAINQACSDAVLDNAHLMTERRLRDVQPLGGAREIQLLREHDEKL